MIYVASPYSSPDPIIRKTRFLITQNFVLHLLRNHNIAAFSPIMYWHEVATTNSLPFEAKDWQAFNTDMIRHCEGAYFLELRGHEESKGMEFERRICRILHIPMFRFGEDFMPIIEHESTEIN